MPARKTMRKDGRYQASILLGYDENGKMKRKYFYGESQKAANAKKQAFIDRMSVGQKVQSDTLNAWVSKWIATSSNNPATRKVNELYAKKLCQALGDRRLEDIRTSDIKIFAQSMSGYSFSTVKKVKGVVNKIFQDAVNDRLIVFNPTAGIRWDYAFKGTHRALEGWEKALIADNHQEHRVGRWALLMLFAGLRRGEALALQWEDIDMENDTIHVTKAIHFEGNAAVVSTTKTEAGVRDVPLLSQLKTALSLYEPRTGSVCLDASGNPITTEAAFRRGWESYLNAMENILNGQPAFKPGRRSDLHDENWKSFSIRTHDLRHTFCTMLYNAGIGLKEAQYIMGHADMSMTMEVYTHLDAAKRQSAASIMIKYKENFDDMK